MAINAPSYHWIRQRIKHNFLPPHYCSMNFSRAITRVSMSIAIFQNVKFCQRIQVSKNDSAAILFDEKNELQWTDSIWKMNQQYLLRSLLLTCDEYFLSSKFSKLFFRWYWSKHILLNSLIHFPIRFHFILHWLQILITLENEITHYYIKTMPMIYYTKTKCTRIRSRALVE